VDDLSAVPEAYRSSYQKSADNKYILTELEIPDDKDVAGLLSKRDELLRENKAFKDKYKDIDPDQYAQLRKEADRAKRDELEKTGQWQALERQLLDKHAVEVKGKDERIGQLMGAIELSMIDSAATAAIVAAKGSPALLLPAVRQSVRIFEEDGKFVPKVIGT